MSQAEGPEAQVGGRVGDAAQTVFYGMDSLDDCNISKIKLRKTKTISTDTMGTVTVSLTVSLLM